MDKMLSKGSTGTKDDELECQKAQEVIGQLLQNPDEKETNFDSSEIPSKSIPEQTNSTITVSVENVSPLNICQVSFADQSGMIIDASELVHQSLEGASSIQLEDGTTAFVQSFEAVDDPDSRDATAKFIDGQAVQLEDGTTAFIHASPREGLQPVQLEDGTLAYLSQSRSDLFDGESSSIDLEQLANSAQITDVEMKELDIKLTKTYSPVTSIRVGEQGVAKAFRCGYPECGRVYTTLHHLKVHERSHTGDRPFKCSLSGCGKAFATGYGLKSHTRVHTGETPYKCPEETCQKAFKTSGDLQKHVRTHTGERPFKCTFLGCDRAFTTSNIRKVHMRTHTGERPYICALEGCSRAFASATNYKNHMRIHTGEKPYICSVSGCNKRFTEYSSLYKHHVVHTHNKPYLCSFCGKNYRQASTLAMHKRTAHGVVESCDNEIATATEDSEKKISKTVEDTTEGGKEETKLAKRIFVRNSRKDSISGSIVSVPTTVPVNKPYPTIVTLQNNNSNQVLQEHPVYAVQLQEDGTLSTTMQQIVLVTDPAQIAALQQLANQGQFETMLSTNNSSSTETSSQETLKQCVQILKSNKQIKCSKTEGEKACS